MFKTIFIRSDFLNQGNDISIDIENDLRENILKELEKHIDENLDLSMFDLEQVSEDEYTLDLNDKGKFYLLINEEKYKKYLPKNISSCTFELDFLVNVIEANDIELFLNIINLKQNIYDFCLNRAVKYEKTEIIKILLNPDLYIKDYQTLDDIFLRETPLHIAVKYYQEEILHFLLNQKIKHKQDDNGRTPLYLACYKGYTNIVKIILNDDLGLKSILIGDLKGKNPLHIACRYSKIIIRL